MNFLATNQVAKNEVGRYATSQDIRHVFIDDMAELYRISFLLTGDRDRAEECFVAGLDDCVKGDKVFREWAHSWAKRKIIQQAIRRLQPHPEHAAFSAHATDFAESKSAALPIEHLEINRVLALEKFERFVFVMSVLEHYSVDECARLLRCSLQDIVRARIRALGQLVNSDRAPSTSDRMTLFRRRSDGPRYPLQ
jgi:DNA-directed RNA polymerase specialized sigma24 family protein